MRIRFLLLLLALLAPSAAWSQASVYMCIELSSGIDRCQHVSATNPLPVSATISGFTALTTGTPISVTTGGVTGTLPAGSVVVASNVGTTNAAYCALGASATTSSQYIPPGGGWFAFTVGAATQLTCITSTSTTTVNMTGGSGIATGTGGGSGSGSGGSSATFGAAFPATGTAVGGTDGTNFVPLKLDATGQYLQVIGIGLAQGSTTSGQTGSLVMGAVTTAAPSYTTAQTSPLSLDTAGNLRVSNTQSSQYPVGSAPISISATGTTGATAATLAASASLKTYMCTMSVRSNATAAATGNLTVVGIVTGTQTYNHWTAPVASGIGITEMIFTPCVPSSAINTAIVITSPAPGSGGVVSVNATGYQAP